jgi:hypothetical protein
VLATLWQKTTDVAVLAEGFQNTIAIDGVGSILLRNLKDKSVLIKQIVS